MFSVAIDDLLNRRSDLSTFLVHLTKDDQAQTARDNLRSILRSRTLEARSPMGWKNGLPPEATDKFKVVCFSEAPLEHAYSLATPIPGRRTRLSKYGLVFSKAVARERDCNPVWYVDMTPRSSWAIAKALDQLRDQLKTVTGSTNSPAWSILPFVEAMGTWANSRKEFSWEREWRHLGDFSFVKTDVTVVLCPEGDIVDFEAMGYRAIDPSWSMERMLAALATAPVRRRLSVAV
jgi:hypothetical protein